MSEFIPLTGARENNLKDVTLRIPKGRLTVFTGVSGSGKSSVVFDSIAVESQHHLDVVTHADWIVDLGPDRGRDGGEVIFTGTPRQLLDVPGSFTAEHLRRATAW